MRIIVDAFGGDNAPDAVVKGAALAVKEYGHTIVLVGDEAKVRAACEKNQVSTDGFEFVQADDVIRMEDEPRSILKEHKGCSMAVGLKLVAEGKGDAFVTAGSTGALIMGSTFLVKRIKGVSRAALAPIMPAEKKPVMIIDSGANVDCRPEMLLHFAHMGSIYMTNLMCSGKQATVGLANVGTEDCKGGDLQHETFQLLKADDRLSFVGNIEARDIPFNVADVIVCDGFTGNVILKLTEGVAQFFMNGIKEVFLSNLKTKIAALMIKPSIKGFKKKMDTTEYGGAPLLGVKKPVIKAHGNSNPNAIKNAIRVAAEFAKAGVIEQIAEAVKKDPEQEK